ncbi:MAG: hypothetical protein Q9181_003769 [Wetmoreana brouardii]
MSAGGLEYAASIGGLVSLSLTLFQGCVQAFNIVQSASHVGVEADNFRCKVELEQYKLIQWAERIGLEEQPSNRLNWNLIANLLKQLETLLSDTQQLKRKYRLELVQLESIASTQVANFPLASSRIIHHSNGSARKLKWAVFDKDKAANLVRDITYFNNGLYDLLDVVNQDFVKSALASVLRDIISRSNATSELEIIKQLLGSTNISTSGAVAAAASLKQIRLVLGFGPETSSVGRLAERTPPEGLRLKLRQLKPTLLQRESPGSPPGGRELARYKSSLVLVEWKFVDRELEGELKRRVEQLAILLAHTNDGCFHSLHCIGILPKDSSYQPRDENIVCYGLVFDLPVPETQSASAVPVTRPLSSLYTGSRKPSLNERRDIALALAETVLQLHTSGWLHKGIRSDNVLFVDVGDNRWQHGNASGPFLAGYEYTRPANAQTEATPAIPEHEIYQHPKGQGLARANFRMSFDLFALGCVLLEIGLWSNMLDILERASSEVNQNGGLGTKFEVLGVTSEKVDWARLHTAKARLLANDDEELRNDLAGIAFHAGKTFQEAILLCLYADEGDPDDEDVGVQKLVIDLLRQSTF